MKTKAPERIIASNRRAFNEYHVEETYEAGSDHDPVRVSKLLRHRREIQRLLGKTKERGLTLIPLKLYFKEGRAKVELALARGKTGPDKRESLKKREEHTSELQ